MSISLKRYADPMRVIISFAIALPFLFSPTPAEARGYFDFNTTARAAYDKLLNLRLKEAKTQIANFRRNEPDNLIGVFLENYQDCITAFVDDDESRYRQLSKQMNGRLDKISKGDRNSPYYLYCQGEIRLQWAALRMRYGDYLTGASDVKQGYALLEENAKRHPEFVANLKMLGLLHAVVGNVPDEYRWAVRGVSGISGTIEQGVGELEQVIQYAKTHPEYPFKEEGIAVYAFLLLHLNNQSDQAWQTLQSSGLDPKTNPLVSVAMANVGMKTGRNDDAIRLLQQCPTGAEYHPFPYRHFQLGIAKLNRLDTDANQPLETFVYTFHGEFGLKEAHQKLAWYALMKGDQQGYWNHLYQAKIRGSNRSDTDKAADREANTGEMPDVRLLKARLLFDGGYYQRAYDELRGHAGDYAQHRKHNIEYQYRMGRVCHKMGKSAEAIKWYGMAIAAGEKEPWYFACNAAYQTGLLYEDRREWANARTWYQRCLKIQPDEYAASLHARAKAGLNRIKKKK